MMKKKISLFLTALLAVVMLGGMTSCNSDDNEENVSNMERYQREVEQSVRSQKKHNKAILLVAFGSTWQKAFDSFDATVEAYKQAFPDYDVFLSFSSAICINRSAAGQHTKPRNYYAPQFWLQAFGKVKYAEIIVQSLQVIPGEEYGRVVNAVKDFANNANGDLDDDYLNPEKGNLVLKIGLPLMASADEDVANLAKALHENFGAMAAKGTVALMGHGNPDEYDTYRANIRYTQLEEALQQINKNYFVGTVDMMHNFKTDVLKRMRANGINDGTVYCVPLMSIAGDHAHNDMAGDDAEFNYNKENGEMEDTSWKKYFESEKYNCNNETMILEGLLDFKNIRNLWLNHTKEAMVVDYYHTKNAE